MQIERGADLSETALVTVDPTLLQAEQRRFLRHAGLGAGVGGGIGLAVQALDLAPGWTPANSQALILLLAAPLLASAYGLQSIACRRAYGVRAKDYVKAYGGQLFAALAVRFLPDQPGAISLSASLWAAVCSVAVVGSALGLLLAGFI
jgi:hypothetical protein